MSLLSVLGRITLWQLLWWPSGVLVCARQQTSELVPAHFRGQHLECVPVRPSPPAGAEVEWQEEGGGGTTCAAAFCPLPPLRSALHSLALSSHRYYTASAMRPRRRERRREGTTERRGAPRTPARTNCELSVSLSPRQKHTSLLLLSSAAGSQRRGENPTCALSPSLSLDPIFVRLSFSLFLCSLLSLFFLSFFYVPGEVKWSGLLTQRDPGLIALCITPREKQTDLQTDKEKEREKPARKKRRGWENEKLLGGSEKMEGVGEQRERERERRGEREREDRMRAGSGETKRRWWDGGEEGEEGRVRGRGEAASGPAYANPPWAASKSGRQAATAEEWAAFSHRERRCEGGKREERGEENKRQRRREKWETEGKNLKGCILIVVIKKVSGVPGIAPTSSGGLRGITPPPPAACDLLCLDPSLFLRFWKPIGAENHPTEKEWNK